MQIRLELALDAAQMGLWDWDLATDELVWDARSMAMFGVHPAALTGLVSDIEEPIHDEDLPRVQAALGHALETAGTVDVEFRVVWPDGSVRRIYARGQALTGEGGAVTRMIGANLDVTEQRRVAEQRAEDAARMGGLVSVAQRLGEARTETEVLEVVSVHGVALLGAQGAALCLRVPGQAQVRTLATSFFEDELRADVAVLPADMPLPAVHAAMTGTAHFLPDRASGIARFPGSEGIYAAAHTEASASIPLRGRGGVFGALAVAFEGRHSWRPAEEELLTTFAALTAQALERVHAQEAERAATAESQRLSEALQRSLLTDPPEPNELQIAVRYQPATQETQVGGDWYDAFRTPDGAITLVIGDVAGHDRNAIAAMAQVRNILRGIAQTLDAPPAAVLAGLDRAVVGLGLPTLATAVLCRLDDDPAGSGQRMLRWSNAGHPPPLLVRDDGSAEFLWRDADLLLGLHPDQARRDHEVLLPPGSTLVLYTDGLIERRDASLDEGLDRLRAVATELGALSTEEICTGLLERLAVDAEDDVALLVIRA